MEALVRLLGQSITRYILPGMIFYLFVFFIPISIYFPNDTSFITSTIFIIIAIISCGYLLDAVRVYRYSSPKAYKKDKIDLLQNIRNIKNIQSLIDNNIMADVTDPDIFMSLIWYHDSKNHGRIFEERSEWVMILISSSVLFLSAVENLLILGYLLCSQTCKCWMIPTLIISSGILCLAWFYSAKTGIQRMKAHDEKIVYCLKQIAQEHTSKTTN